MNKNLIYIVGATVLVGGGAYLFLKNKKAKDLAKLDELDKAESDAKGNDKGKNKAESEDSDDESD
jgi:LPXTG-motif cell wall-anchored protein